MKILNLKAKNFRNLKSVNVDFQDINILTGRNSVWKTNLIQLLRNCLNTSTDIEEYFGKNVVSIGTWISSTTIEAKVSWGGNIYGYVDDDWVADLYKIKEYTLRKEIVKNPLSLKKMSIKTFWQSTTIKDFDIDKFDFSDSIFKDKPKVTKDAFIRDYSNENNILREDSSKHIVQFKNLVEWRIISHDDSSPFSICSSNIFKYVTWVKEENKKELAVQAIDQLWKKLRKPWTSNFTTAKFIFLLADLQWNLEQFKTFKKDLSFFTNWVLRNVYINENGSHGWKGDIFVESPNWPRNIEFISAGTSIMLYFVLIKNWIKLPMHEKSYKNPEIMVFDELDSSIHPSIIPMFVELLISLSKNIQIFISSHSTSFIDCFSRDQLFLIKDIWSFNEKVNVNSNILSYNDILNSLNDKEKEVLSWMDNSELYVNCDIDSVFPTK